MTEQKLKAYLENKLSAELLRLDLKDSQLKTGYDTKTIYIETLSEEFKINKDHIIKILDDSILGKLSPTDLNTIGMALMASDCFYWEEKTEDGERIENVIFELDNPDISHEISLVNIKLWKEYLLTGVYNLNKKKN